MCRSYRHITLHIADTEGRQCVSQSVEFIKIHLCNTYQKMPTFEEPNLEKVFLDGERKNVCLLPLPDTHLWSPVTLTSFEIRILMFGMECENGWYQKKCLNAAGVPPQTPATESPNVVHILVYICDQTCLIDIDV